MRIYIPETVVLHRKFAQGFSNGSFLVIQFFLWYIAAKKITRIIFLLLFTLQMQIFSGYTLLTNEVNLNSGILFFESYPSVATVASSVNAKFCATGRERQQKAPWHEIRIILHRWPKNEPCLKLFREAIFCTHFKTHCSAEYSWGVFLSTLQ